MKAWAAGLLVTSSVLAACQPVVVVPTPTPGPNSSAAGGPSRTPEPHDSLGPQPSPTIPDDASPVVLDPSLLDVLPESIDGFPVKGAPDEAAIAITDPALPEIATALDAGAAVGDGNIVAAIVVKLRPDAFDGEKYRQWRDSYDDAACSAAQGVARHAEANIGGHQVFITSCVGEMRTYHVWLKEQDIVISASSIGEGRFGEKLMGSLRVPA